MSYGVGLDHDPVVICPYDGNHKIAKSRIQKHLVKCEKNFPPNYKKQCPYDATHRVFEDELVEHVKSCPMKLTCPIDLGLSNRVSLEKASSDQEIWDEDLEHSFKQESSSSQAEDAHSVTSGNMARVQGRGTNDIYRTGIRGRLIRARASRLNDT